MTNIKYGAAVIISLKITFKMKFHRQISEQKDIQQGKLNYTGILNHIYNLCFKSHFVFEIMQPPAFVGTNEIPRRFIMES